MKHTFIFSCEGSIPRSPPHQRAAFCTRGWRRCMTLALVIPAIGLVVSAARCVDSRKEMEVALMHLPFTFAASPVSAESVPSLDALIDRWAADNEVHVTRQARIDAHKWELKFEAG